MSGEELGNLGCRDLCQERNWAIWGAEIDVRRKIGLFGVQRLMSGEELGNLGFRDWCQERNWAIWGADSRFSHLELKCSVFSHLQCCLACSKQG